MKHIFKCTKCSKYTMKEVCGCGSRTLLSKPLKYSPEDRLGTYRRKSKMQEYAARGLI